MKELSVFGVFFIVMLAANVIVFLLMREHYKPKSKFTICKNMPFAKTAIYVVGGRGGVTRKLANNLADSTLHHVTLVECGLLGWDPKRTAEQIAFDAMNNRMYAKVEVYTVGIGCQVVNDLVKQLPWVRDQIIVLDPCPNESVLREPLQIGLACAYHLLHIVSYGIGMLSYVPIPCFTGKTTSIVLLLDQMSQLRKGGYVATRGVAGIVYRMRKWPFNYEATLNIFARQKGVRIGEIGEDGVVGAYRHALEILR